MRFGSGRQDFGFSTAHAMWAQVSAHFSKNGHFIQNGQLPVPTLRVSKTITILPPTIETLKKIRSATDDRRKNVALKLCAMRFAHSSMNMSLLNRCRESNLTLQPEN